MSGRKKTPVDEGWRDLAGKLPTAPGGMLAEGVCEAIYDGGELGEHYLLYKRTSMTLEPEIKQTMTPEDWIEYDKQVRNVWGAACRCTCCGEEFQTGWVQGGGIYLVMGEDGCTYPDPEGVGMQFLDGETLDCPCCLNRLELQPFREVRSGRTWQVLQPELAEVDGYDAVIFWLVSRTTYADGSDGLGITPRDALIVDKGGKLRRFQFRAGAWQPCVTVRDPEQVTYYSWEAANHRAVGGWGFQDYPEELTLTAEKTALEIYAEAGGTWPGRYLQLWQRHPHVENLMRQGFDWAVTNEIDRKMDHIGYRADLEEVPQIPWVDWKEVKPHRMLHMSREAFRAIRRSRWEAADARVWRETAETLPGTDAREYDEWRLEIGAAGVEKLLDMIRDGWTDLQPGRVIRYLEKQKLLEEGVDILIDYRKMIRQDGAEENEETRWPRRLMAAHDRLSEVLTARRQMATEAAYLRVKKIYDGLEWSDGELCVLLPVSEMELKREGKILRHCVGTYGRQHLGGKLIFFVRHHRRPERPYYTLNIDMTGEMPREIQLHGYGNEHHGVHKQHRHKIPQKVRDFCDRWEREVLTPWWAENRRPAKQKKQKGEKTA